MVKKSDPAQDSPPVPPASLFDSRLAESVKDSAQQIWLAGMGAFAKAQAEGTKMFESLVKEGLGLQRKTQSAAEERFADVADKMSTMASEASSKAGASWGRLENIFEERTAKALGKLGVPTARDVAELTRRVEELSAAVAALGQAAASAAPATPARKTAARPKANKAVTPVAPVPSAPLAPAAPRTPAPKGAARNAPRAAAKTAAKTVPKPTVKTAAKFAAKPAAKSAKKTAPSTAAAAPAASPDGNLTPGSAPPGAP